MPSGPDGQERPGDAGPGAVSLPRDSGTHCSLGAGWWEEGKSRSSPDGWASQSPNVSGVRSHSRNNA